MNRIHLIPMLMLSLLLGACSDDRDDNQQKSAREILDALNPCALLTAEDIQAVTGQAMKPGSESHDVTCIFESVEVKGEFDVPKYRWSLYHMRHPVPLEQEIKKYHDGNQELMGNSYQSTPISGVGDRAYWEHFTGVTQLTVYKSDGANATDTISVQPDFDGEEQMLEQSKALAARALERL